MRSQSLLKIKAIGYTLEEMDEASLLCKETTKIK
jgi:hypothetical protein